MRPNQLNPIKNKLKVLSKMEVCCSKSNFQSKLDKICLSKQKAQGNFLLKLSIGHFGSNQKLRTNTGTDN